MKKVSAKVSISQLFYLTFSELIFYNISLVPFCLWIFKSPSTLARNRQYDREKSGLSTKQALLFYVKGVEKRVIFYEDY